MTYNQNNQLKTATVSGTASTYTYDAFGQRMKLKVGTSPFAIQTYDQWGELLTEHRQCEKKTKTAPIDSLDHNKIPTFFLYEHYLVYPGGRWVAHHF